MQVQDVLELPRIKKATLQENVYDWDPLQDFLPLQEPQSGWIAVQPVSFNISNRFCSHCFLIFLTFSLLFLW